MKLKTKAGVPIGTIAIIIVVLIASFAMWWYFTQRDGLHCSDVKYLCDGYGPDGKCDHHDYRMADVPSDQFVNIEWWETSGQWRVKVYVQSNGVITTFVWFDDPDDLNDWFQAHYAFSDEQKVDFARMMDCIQADCPGCI